MKANLLKIIALPIYMLLLITKLYCHLESKILSPKYLPSVEFQVSPHFSEPKVHIVIPQI